jgi:hypothetical protein
MMHGTHVNQSHARKRKLRFGQMIRDSIYGVRRELTIMLLRSRIPRGVAGQGTSHFLLTLGLYLSNA